MLSRALLLLITAELAVYGGLGLKAGYQPAGALALAVLGHLLLLAALVIFSYSIAWTIGSHRPPESRIGPLQATRGLLREIGVMVFVYSWLQPLAPWLRQPSPPDRTGGNDHRFPPVILVHGYFCNSGIWWWLRRQLEAAGFQRVYSVDLEPLLESIDELAHSLAARVEEVRRLTAAPRVLLVGHSMGGLVIRAYLRQSSHAAAVQGAVFLAAPHQGTRLARLAIGRNGAQMRSHSAWLGALARDEQSSPPPTMVSIFSWHDNLVVPPGCAELPGIPAEAVTEIGHMAVAFSPRVAALVVDHLRAHAAAAQPGLEERQQDGAAASAAALSRRPAITTDQTPDP